MFQQISKATSGKFAKLAGPSGSSEAFVGEEDARLEVTILVPPLGCDCRSYAHHSNNHTQIPHIYHGHCMVEMPFARESMEERIRKGL